MERKVVKIFISSTFKDLDKERSYIVNTVFQNLESKYPNYKFDAIDLRWGITEEEAKGKQVVDLCMRYLYECRPHFIGILGSRYGSVLSKHDTLLSPVVESYYPHLHQDIENRLSVTEIEIMNGVLRSEYPINAIFFIKENLQLYPGDSLEDFNKQLDLIQRIKSQSLYKVYTFSDDLSAFDKIEEYYKELLQLSEKDSITNEYEKKAIWEKAFIENKSFHEKYYQVGFSLEKNSDLLNRIADYLEKDRIGVLMKNFGGSGCSSLLSHLFENSHQEENTIYLYCYGDHNNIPLTTYECFKYFTFAAHEEIKRKWEKENKVRKLINCFRIGLTDHNIDIEDQLIKEMKRYRWRFIFDNLGYNGYRDFNPLYQMSRSLFSVQKFIEDKFKTDLDIKYFFVLYKHSSDGEELQAFHFTKPNAFYANIEIDQYLSEYYKKLSPEIGNKLSSASVVAIPGCLTLICKYMINYLHNDQLSDFVNKVSSFDSIYQVYTLYLDELINLVGFDAAKRLISILLICQNGIYEEDLRKLSNMEPITFRSAFVILYPFLIRDSVCRIRGAYYQSGLKSVLSISEDDLCRLAEELELYFYSKIKYEGTWEYFVNIPFEFTFPYYYQKCIPNYCDMKIYDDNYEIKANDYFLSHGGINEENSDKAYDAFRWSRIYDAINSTYNNKLRRFESCIEENVNNFKIPTPADYYYLQAHIETLIISNNISKLKEKLVTPMYINTLYRCPAYIYAWQWMLKSGFPMKHESLKNKLDIRTNRMLDLCEILGRTDDMAYYREYDRFKLRRGSFNNVSE